MQTKNRYMLLFRRVKYNYKLYKFTPWKNNVYYIEIMLNLEMITCYV